MAQLKIQVSQEFEQMLHKYMEIKHVSIKSDAIEIAIREGLERETIKTQTPDFSSWIGFATKLPINLHPKFQSDDDSWK